VTSDAARTGTHRHGAWRAHHTWHEDSTSVRGQFEDGTQVDVATWRDEHHRWLRA